MSDIAVTGEAVALCLTAEELRERGLSSTITDSEARALVHKELLLAGYNLWLSMEVELFSCRGSLLLIARPAGCEMHCFAFRNLEDLISLSEHWRSGLKNRLVFYEETYYLIIQAEFSDIPCALLEFGERVDGSEKYAIHASEHGKTLIAASAMSVINSKFGKQI